MPSLQASRWRFHAWLYSRTSTLHAMPCLSQGLEYRCVCHRRHSEPRLTEMLELSSAGGLGRWPPLLGSTAPNAICPVRPIHMRGYRQARAILACQNSYARLPAGQSYPGLPEFICEATGRPEPVGLPKFIGWSVMCKKLMSISRFFLLLLHDFL